MGAFDRYDPALDRFTDDLALVPHGEYVPTLCSILLRRAGVADAPREEQAAVIHDFLASHPLVPTMAYSIRADGFGELLA